jgi:thioredoxin reductase (NADPH)
MKPDPNKTLELQALAPSTTEVAFPRFTREMISRVREYASELKIPAQGELFYAGKREADMYVILAGTVRVYALDENNKRALIATQGPREFTGELDLISSRRTLAHGSAETECLLLKVLHKDLRRLFDAEGDIANLIMQAAIARRAALIEANVSGVVLLGDVREARTLQLQRFLTRNSYPHRVVDPLGRLNAEKLPSESDDVDSNLPAIVFQNGDILRRPSIAAVADILGLTESIEPDVIYDVIVVGAGPSGLATAVYAASEGLSVLVLESSAPGGQAGTSSRIENYLGFPTGVSGLELAMRAQLQAQKFGARIIVSRDVTSLRQIAGLHQIRLSDGTKAIGRSVVAATGARYSKLDVPHYDRFEHQGIHYAATGMEAKLCSKQECIVVGGGNSAGQAALFLAGFAKQVHIVIRGKSLNTSMSQYLISRVESSNRIVLHSEAEISGLVGDATLRCVEWIHRKTGEVIRRKAENMFVMIGAQPNTSWLRGIIALDDKGFVLTEMEASFEDSRYATNVPGVFAVGDVRSKSIKRVASAVGEGSAVVSDLHRYLASIDVGQGVETDTDQESPRDRHGAANQNDALTPVV